VNHLLFSPADPHLLMYCHEGMWQKVDRIWLIHTDGTGNQLIHKRTMYMEIAGHEFWGLDGKTIWYDWQYPKGEDFFVAGYNLETHKRVAYHLQRNEWSIHFNLTQDLDLFCGDGGDSGQVARAPDGEWIELFRPQMIGGTEGALNDPNFWQPGVFHSEHLVNMAHQNYRAEPALLAGQEVRLLHQQYVWAQLRLRGGGGQGRRPDRSCVHAGAGHPVQPHDAYADYNAEVTPPRSDCA
jgi:oligogalacturonide lyase